MKKIISILMLMLLTGCVAPRPVVNLSSPFDAAQAQAMLVQGKNTITGSALIKRQDGIAVTCAGTQVNLTPVTAYSTERIQAIYKSNQRGYGVIRPEFVPDLPEYRTLVRNTTCNAQGFFAFKEVADGDFYVTTGVTWKVGANIQGGALMQRVKVIGGQSTEIVLAP